MNHPATDEGDEYSEPEPQTIKVYILDRNHSMTTPVDEFPITEDKRIEITIELEDGQSGGYQVRTDKQIIAENTFHYDDIE